MGKSTLLGRAGGRSGFTEAAARSDQLMEVGGCPDSATVLPGDPKASRLTTLCLRFPCANGCAEPTSV